ncbi:unnamed protein product [Symbiodinium sp. CCMP2592]|nr:unnamed protein product [Symbiodinium sp. CCMP2592]
MDVERQKCFECLLICLARERVGGPSARSQDWCRMLSRARRTHSFDEEDVCRIIRQHLQTFCNHALDPRNEVVASAHRLIAEYGRGGKPVAHKLIIEATLSRMRHLVSLDGKEVWVAWQQMPYSMRQLEAVLRSLSKPQRQEWVSLLVRGLHRIECRLESVKSKFTAARAAEAAEYFNESQKLVMEDLMLLWCVDEDPCQTYEDVTAQLSAGWHPRPSRTCEQP